MWQHGLLTWRIRVIMCSIHEKPYRYCRHIKAKNPQLQKGRIPSLSDPFQTLALAYPEYEHRTLIPQIQYMAAVMRCTELLSQEIFSNLHFILKAFLYNFKAALKGLLRSFTLSLNYVGNTKCRPLNISLFY